LRPDFKLKEEPVRTANEYKTRRRLLGLVVPTALECFVLSSLMVTDLTFSEQRTCAGQPLTDKSGLIYPLIPEHGGVVPLLRAAEQPRKDAKAVFDITADARPGEVNKGLEQVARLLNLYGAAGLKSGDVKIAAVCHGDADKTVLSDFAYRARFKLASNPNLPLIRELKKAGVKVFVCGQSLHDLGFKVGEVAEEALVADSAMLVLVNKQVDGYAYIPAR
jgi:intracellular sulfur oxidation DsrE/DsrF family protein